jgi:hypothetical protein
MAREGDFRITTGVTSSEAPVARDDDVFAWFRVDENRHDTASTGTMPPSLREWRHQAGGFAKLLADLLRLAKRVVAVPLVGTAVGELVVVAAGEP